LRDGISNAGRSADYEDDLGFRGHDAWKKKLSKNARVTENGCRSVDDADLKLVQFKMAEVGTCPALNPKLAKLGKSSE